MTAIASPVKHVIVLDDHDHETVLKALDRERQATLGLTRAEPLLTRLQFGEHFNDAIDERVALQDRKEALAAAVKQNDARIKEVNDAIDEEWTETGTTSIKRDGITVHRNRGRVYAKVARTGDEIQPAERQAACDALKTDPVTAVFVREDFAGASVGAHFKTVAEEYDLAQRELPPHERQPRDINDFLPPACAGVVELSDNPTISVKRS